MRVKAFKFMDSFECLYISYVLYVLLLIPLEFAFVATSTRLLLALTRSPSIVTFINLLAVGYGTQIDKFPLLPMDRHQNILWDSSLF